MFKEEKISEVEGQKLAEEIGAMFQLTSAFNNFGIEELFKKTGLQFLKNIEQNSISSNSSSKNSNPSNNDKVKLEQNKKDKKKKRFC